MAREDAEHVQAIIDEGKFNRRPAKTETLRANCKRGYVFTTTSQKSGATIAAGQSEFHHILPIEVLGDDSICPDGDLQKLDFFHNCMAVTKWDINEEHNLIGLPTREVFENAERNAEKGAASGAGTAANPFASALREISAKLSFFGILPDLPCHEIEHYPDYNQKVKDYLKMNVWDPLSTKQASCDIDSTQVRSKLVSAADHWRSFLVNRGASNQGASHCWTNRNKPEYKSIWYIPMSMNPGKPRPVDPPPELSKRKGSIDKWIQSLIPAR